MYLSRNYLRLLLMAVFALFLTIGFAAQAHATVAQDPAVPATPGLTIPEIGVSVVIGLFLPVLYGFLVRPSNPEIVKVVGGIVIAAVAALVMNAVQDDGTAVISWQQVVDSALIYLPQIAAYLGVWKPLDINARTGPGVAIGSGPTQ